MSARSSTRSASRMDISVENNVREVAALARDAYGEIDLWFSNAGRTGPSLPADLADNALWESLWGVHVMSHVYAVREVLPAMLRRGDGYLLQTASLIAMATEADKAAYSVTKHAALALAEWLAVNYRRKGSKVSCFCPGPMLTSMLRAEDYPDDHPVIQRARTPGQVADQLVQAIDQEHFLIVDSPVGQESLGSKSTDYEAWIDRLAVRFG
ncbi:SDR family NAD(P)-dependent oxidoreductase [Actinomadura sp. CNU-125]|uniref:SDR family NAD(P)-dependent oxidoreductase n=1 Tax=Actinomadura sp. CNU-125 TaxID=1904961 RepID=UPI0021CC92FF|nr:SDR family oxidoreductase [Actinomadura sp. CNU-125]